MPRIGASPLESLRQEHQVAKERLDRLEAVLPELIRTTGAAAERSREVLAEIVAFLSRELESHLLKEEVALFSPLEKALEGSVGPITAMRAEHAEMRAHHQALRQLLGRLEAGEDDAAIRGELESRCRATVSLIRRHLDQEDAVIFRLAEEMLSPRALRSLARKMASFGG